MNTTSNNNKNNNYLNKNQTNNLGIDLKISKLLSKTNFKS